MGRISGPYDRREHDVDVLVVGYGRAGRAAARAACAVGRTVLAVDAGQVGRTLVPRAPDTHNAPEDRPASGEPREEILPARAHFLGPHHVELRPLGVDVAAGETKVHAKRVIIATGTCPVYPEATGLADTRFMIAVGAHRMVPSDVPLGAVDGPVRAAATLRAGNGPVPFELSDLADRSVVVLGAGRTGCSVAWALAVLGAQVTLVEAAERVLPRLDPGLSAVATEVLQESDVRVMLHARATGLAPTLDEGAWIGTEKAGDVAAEHLVLATGHRPFTAGLDLKSAGVRLSPSGAVLVDGGCRTTGRGVLAAGEVTGCSRETAAPMGLFAGTCVTQGRFGKHPAWSEPLLPVTLALPPAGRGKAMEMAQVGCWSRTEDGRIEQVRKADSSGSVERTGETPGAQGRGKNTRTRAAGAGAPVCAATAQGENGSRPQDGPPLRIMRFSDRPDPGASGPMVAFARSAQAPGTLPVGFALVGDGAIALAAAVTASLSGGMEAELLAQIVEGAGALGGKLAQALRTDERRGGSLTPAPRSVPRAPVPSPRSVLRPEDVGRER